MNDVILSKVDDRTIRSDQKFHSEIVNNEMFGLLVVFIDFMKLGEHNHQKNNANTQFSMIILPIMLCA